MPIIGVARLCFAIENKLYVDNQITVYRGETVAFLKKKLCKKLQEWVLLKFARQKAAPKQISALAEAPQVPKPKKR